MRNWMDQLLPKMQKRATPHFDIYYTKHCTAEQDIEEIVQKREEGYQEVCEFLGHEPDIRVCLVFFEDEETKHKETGHRGAGWAFGTTIVEVNNPEVQLDPYHEVVHILTNDYGDPPALFREGFATAMSEYLGALALKDLGGGKSSLYERVRQLKANDDWIPLEELLTYTDIGPMWSRPPVSYAEASAFVKFLLDAYGKEKFLEAYRGLKNSEEKEVHQQNQAKFEQIYGKSLDMLRQEWYEAMGLLTK